MTATLNIIGDHIHPADHPEIDLVVDYVSDQVPTLGVLVVEAEDSAGQIWILIEGKGEPCGSLLRTAADRVGGARRDALLRAAAWHEAEGCTARAAGLTCISEQDARDILWGHR